MLKCTKIDFAPLGSLQGSPRLSSWNKRDLLLKEGEGYREEKGRRERGRQGRREGRKWEEMELEGNGEDPRVHLRIACIIHFLISGTYITYTVVYKSRSRDPGHAPLI